jgi:hypothetical protein
MIKKFIIECLLFQTDKTYNPSIPTWVIGVFTWVQILIIIFGVIKIIKRF